MDFEEALRGQFFSAGDHKELMFSDYFKNLGLNLCWKEN